MRPAVVLGRLVLALGVILAALGPVAAPARAAGIAFTAPTATAEYGVGLRFTVDATTTNVPDRVELELWFPGAIGPYLAPIEVPRSGSRTLEYAWLLGEDGYLQPNTTVRSRWAAHAADGTVTRSDWATVTYRDTRFEWQSLAGDVVRVHWYDGGRAFGQRALAIGEEAVAETAALLGVEETDPIDFFIYADTAAFREALGPGTRENVGGQANAEIRTLFALIEPAQIDDAWVSIVIPHELVHLVFDTTVANPYRYPPVWLNEGLATYLSEGYTASDRGRVQAAVRDGTLMPLEALVGSFPRQGERIPLAYAEGASAVDFLVRTHGDEALVTLVQAYGDGVSDDDAFTRALGMTAAAFEEEWLASLDAEDPVRYGPQPAPPGPLPPGWAGADGSPVPTGAPVDPGTTASPDPSPGAGDAGGPGVAVVVLATVAVLVVAGGVVLVLRSRPPR